MNVVALASAAALFAFAAVTHADAVHADTGMPLGADAGYEEVNPKVGRIPAFDPQPNTRQLEAEINPKVGALPLVTPTRANNEGWIEVNAKQGRIPALDHNATPQALSAR